MDPIATFKTIYRITAQHSGKVLDLATIVDNRFTPPFPRLPPPFSSRHLIQFAFHNSDNQKFLLFPQDDGTTYVIANLGTGEVLDIAEASLADEAPCIGHSYKSGSNQEFILNVVNGDVHNIEAKHSGKVLDVFGANKQDRVRVFQHHSKDGQNQRFSFNPVGEYALPNKSELQVLGPVPSPSSVDDNLPDTTVPVLIEEKMLPYFAVNDTLSKDTAVKMSPYYMVGREAFWRKTFDKRFEGPSRTEKFSFVAGMTEVTSRVVELTLGLGLNSENDSSTTFKVLSGVAKLTKMFNLNLKFTDTTTTTTTHTTTIEREFTYSGGAPLLVVEYVLVDRFTVRRADGTPVTIPWEITNGDVVHQDAFPNVPG